MPKYVYGFGVGRAEGRGDQKELLGGKGAGLAEMSRLGIPVPPGFTITTEACRAFQAAEGAYPDGLEVEVAAQLRSLEEAMGRRFGDPDAPLLLSVRSGAPVSMPGMMDTVLNLGLDEGIVAAASDGPESRFLRDCYRRLITMYGNVVLGVPHAAFEKSLAAARAAEGVTNDAELSAAALDRVITDGLEHCRRHGVEFPRDPMAQLWGAIGAVFESFDNKRAREYRRLQGIPEGTGTGVNVQAMVFGNRGPRSATGVAFTRDPGSGERRLYGEYLINAQGEDVVAGIRTPIGIAPSAARAGLAGDFPAAAAELERISEVLEGHYREMQDVEFTIDDERLYMLQTRAGKRTGPAAVRIAVEMANEGLIDRAEALRRVRPGQLEQLMAPAFDAQQKSKAVAEGRRLGIGLPAGPGAASGRIAFTAERAEAMASGGPVVLVREETSPEDIVGMHVSKGIVTSRGGMTSHAAVVARGLGTPCVVGADTLYVDEDAGEVRVGTRVLREGDELSIDGTSGEVIAGSLATRPSPVLRAVLDGEAPESPAMVEAFQSLLAWADDVRRLRVRANADTPEDSRVARAFGAQGIGLCRTEHMFFADERIPWVRQMILATNGASRRAALERLLPVQQADFEGIFAAMRGLPVTVRLLDPPLHEFLPRDPKAIAGLAEQMEVTAETIEAMVSTLAEANPMMGHRGCRLGLTSPEIYEMQVEAITRAVVSRQAAGDDVRAEIMLPLVGTAEELAELRRAARAVVDRVLGELEAEAPILVGTMIEIPRACLVADRVAEHADFFSFGTNDLTQMTFGFSRDDAGRFLPEYVEQGILPSDPFASLDQTGVGQLVALACDRGRASKPELKIGICGEHGGDPASIGFFHRTGLDYVSCSPYRIPIARLAAAHATLEV